MLTVLGSPRRCCDGLTRRETLQAGALALMGGLSLPQLLAAQETRPTRRRAPAKNVIMLYLLGGAATQDMIDLKPDAADGVRSEFRPIATSAPGVQICEHLPRMSRWMHKIAVVRSLNHRAGCHNTLPGYTGLEQMVPDNTITRDTFPPSMGSVCEYMRVNDLNDGRPSPAANLPDYVYMPCYLGWGQAIRRAGPYAGLPGARYDALYTEGGPFRDPAMNPPPAAGRPATVLGEPRLPSSTLTEGVTVDRLNTRRGLMDQIEDQLRQAD